MWKTKLALILGVIGVAAGVLNPLVNRAKDSAGNAVPVVVADIVGGVVVGGAIWAAIGFGIGALIDRSKRGRVATQPYVPAGAGSPLQQLSPKEAGSFADPFRRFEGRYWDGEQWTSHVSTNGKTYLDDPAT